MKNKYFKGAGQRKKKRKTIVAAPQHDDETALLPLTTRRDLFDGPFKSMKYGRFSELIKANVLELIKPTP